MAVCMIGTFIGTFFGLNGGEFGNDCNLNYSESCEAVFRSRSSAYTTMMWVCSMFAWELVDSRRSFFDCIISNPRAWAGRLWSNLFLFWSVVVGIVSVFPTIYIPGLNRVVFLHTGIGAEWGVVIGMAIFFIGSSEAWKWVKRAYLRRKNLMLRKGDGLGEEDLEARTFERFFDGSSSGEEK